MRAEAATGLLLIAIGAAVIVLLGYRGLSPADALTQVRAQWHL